MKKSISIVCMLLLLSSAATFAQDSLKAGVQFKEQVPLSEIISAAQAKNMNIFIDCFTTWCGPCKHMSTVEFPKKISGDYFNANFLNFKEDMEKTTGLEIAKKFNIRAYPTFLILDKDGKEISRVVGSMGAEEFIAKVKKVIETGGVAPLKARFEKGERGQDFLFEYLGALSDAYLQDQCSEVAQLILKGNESKMLTDKKYCDVFMDYVDSPEDAVFQYALAHKAEMTKMVKAETFNDKIENCLLKYGDSFISKTDTSKPHFDAKMKNFGTLMDKLKIENKNDIVNKLYIKYFVSVKDWKNCITLSKKECKTKEPSVGILYYVLYNISKESKDSSIRTQASKIALNQVEFYKKKVAGLADSDKDKKREDTYYIEIYQKMADELVK